MLYQKFTPCEALSPFVECYFTWQSAEPVTDFIVESPPSGFCSMVFNSGDVYHIQTKKYERLAVPKYFVSGQSIYSYKLFLNGRINISGIVYRPAALATFFNFPTFQYTEERIALDTIFPDTQLKLLTTKLSELTQPNEIVKELEAFLMRQYVTLAPMADAIDEAANLIVSKNGMLDVSEIMKNTFMSRRNFERKFFRKVGLSPKYYARLRRISYLMNLIAGKKKVDWAKLFSECEYYDQSHFIKDFTTFTGRTPAQYLLQNAELANFVEKPRENNIRY